MSWLSHLITLSSKDVFRTQVCLKPRTGTSNIGFDVTFSQSFFFHCSYKCLCFACNRFQFSHSPYSWCQTASSVWPLDVCSQCLQQVSIGTYSLSYFCAVYYVCLPTQLRKQFFFTVSVCPALHIRAEPPGNSL